MLPEIKLIYRSERGNTVKILKCFGLSLLSLAMIVTLILFEVNEKPVGSSIAGIVLGFSLPALIASIQDLLDTTDWKVSQRKLMRGGFLKKDSLVRISFAYLYRIKIGNKYLLVPNARGTGKYQPVGGVYKLRGNEKNDLKNLYHVMDDDKISIDESSRNDYRLRLENQYLRKFVKRFDEGASREQLYDLSREFKEEMVEKGLVNWNQITYRVCGRHITELEYGKHFQIYELLLADVVELILTPDQEKDLKLLMQNQSDKYIFATSEEIKALGINTNVGKLSETIADHSIKIIEESEGSLIHIPEYGKTFTATL